jgi:DNA-binding XRE family transcriptional regulator
MGDRKLKQSKARTPLPAGNLEREEPIAQIELDLGELPFALFNHRNTQVEGEVRRSATTDDSHHLIQQVKDNLNPQQIEATVQYLKNKSSLLERVAVEIYQHLTNAYRERLSARNQPTSKKVSEKALPTFDGVPNESNSRSLQLNTNLEGEDVLQPIKGLIEEIFERNRLWEKTAKDIWSNLIVWAVEDMKTEVGEFDLKSLTQEEFYQKLNSLLFENESIFISNRINFLEKSYANSIANLVIQDFDLPNYPLSGLERLLSIHPNSGKKPVPSTERLLSKIDSVAAIPTGLPIVSSISAQLNTALWKPDSSGLAYFRYHSRNNQNNYLEHYITSPGDIEALPWEAAEQIINKFGFNTVKLQFILAAHAMRQTVPWESTFTLKASDIIEEFGWDKNHSTSLPAKRNEVASIAYALSCLLVKAVWVEGRGKNQVDASTPIGRMWELLIDPHGQFDWTTGRIDEPDEVFITVRPGLWTAHFLNQAGNKAKEALYQFGYLALNILKLDPYHDELTLRLAIHLTLDVRIRARDRNPYEYRVQTLLESVLPVTVIQEARQSSEKARSLFNRWNHALELLASLGWQPDEAEQSTSFYAKPYPDWLEANIKIKKPRGWIELWLEQRLIIRPPNPIPDRMAALNSSKKKLSKRLKSEIPVPLNGLQIKESRKAKGWTQAKLAGTLGVHQSLIAKIESGNRPISPDLESSLREVLNL